MKLVVGLSALGFRKLGNTHLELQADQTLGVVLWNSHFSICELKAWGVIQLFIVDLFIPLQ